MQVCVTLIIISAEDIYFLGLNTLRNKKVHIMNYYELISKLGITSLNL